MPHFKDILPIIGYLNLLILALSFFVITADGPASLFQQEPYKTIGEIQVSPIFWCIFIANLVTLIVVFLRLGYGEKRGGALLS